MKLSQVKARVARDAELVELPIPDENGQPSQNSKGEPVVWLIRGDQCAERKAAEDIENKKLLGQQAEEASPDDVRNRRVALATACVGGWRGMEAEDDTPLECTPKHIRPFLEADRKLLELVELRIRSHSRFLNGRSPDSVST